MVVTAAAEKADFFAGGDIRPGQGRHVRGEFDFGESRRDRQLAPQAQVARHHGKKLVERCDANRASIACWSSGVFSKNGIFAGCL